MDKVIKVCGDPHCEAVYHNTPKSATKCKDCGGNLIAINEDTYNKKYADNYFQYDYETMDYYRPKKQEKMNSKINDVSPEIQKEIDEFSKQLGKTYDKKIPYSDRYISLRTALARQNLASLEELYGKELNNKNFKIGDIVGSVHRNSDITSYKILDLTPVAVKMVSLSHANPKSEHQRIQSLGSHWELINPKQSLKKLFDKVKEKPKDKTDTTYKKIGDNPSKFDIGDIIVDALGREWKVIDPDKRGMSILQDLKTNSIQELNAHANPQFKLVGKPDDYSGRIRPTKDNPLYDDLINFQYQIMWWEGAKDNKLPTEKFEKAILELKDKIIKFDETTKNEKWKQQIRVVLNRSDKKDIVDRIEKKYKTKSVTTALPTMKAEISPASKDIDILNKLVAEYIYAKDSATKLFKESLIKEHITDLKKYLNKPEIVENKKWKNSIDTSISSAMAVLNSNVLGRKKETMVKQTIPTKPEKLNFDYLFSSNSGDRKSPTQSAGQLRSMYSGKPKYEKELFNTLFQGNDKNWYKLIKDKDNVWRWSKAEEQSEMKKPEPKPETKSSTTNKIDINNKMYLIQINGKPLSSFKNGDKVFFAGKTQEGNFKTYVEGSVLKKGNEYYIKRFPENPNSKRFATANFNASTKVALKPENEPIYTGDENFKTEKKQEVSVKAEPKKEKPTIPQIYRDTKSEDDLIKSYYEKLDSQPITPRIFAKQLIAVDVLRGYSISMIKSGMQGRANDTGWVSVGGYVDGKNVTTNKVLVQKFKGKEINELFSLQELYNEIQREAGLMPDKETKPKKEKPENTTKDLKDALAGAKAYLKYAKDSEKSDIKAYIRGLEILLK